MFSAMLCFVLKTIQSHFTRFKPDAAAPELRIKGRKHNLLSGFITAR